MRWRAGGGGIARIGHSGRLLPSRVVDSPKRRGDPGRSQSRRQECALRACRGSGPSVRGLAAAGEGPAIPPDRCKSRREPGHPAVPWAEKPPVAGCVAAPAAVADHGAEAAAEKTRENNGRRVLEVYARRIMREFAPTGTPLKRAFSANYLWRAQ